MGCKWGNILKIGVNIRVKWEKLGEGYLILRGKWESEYGGAGIFLRYNGCDI